MAGTLRAYPEEVKNEVKDEFLVSQVGDGYADIAADVGFVKKGCSGRHASWVDFNSDGILDLFLKCFDRKNVMGNYPKQLYM